MKANLKKSYITVPIVLAVALILVVSLTFALFTTTSSGTRQFTLANFTSGVEVSFDNFSSTETGSSAGTARYYTVNLTDASDTHYLGKLRVRVKYNGNGVGLLRVRVTEEWFTTDSGTGITTVMPHAIQMPYTVASPYVKTGTGKDEGNHSKWWDNRTEDYCFYYATPISRASEQTINLITGVDMTKIDTGALPSGTQMRIIIEADTVQVNRYPQYWGLYKLPWTDASSIDDNVT